MPVDRAPAELHPGNTQHNWRSSNVALGPEAPHGQRRRAGRRSAYTHEHTRARARTIKGLEGEPLEPIDRNALTVTLSGTAPREQLLRMLGTRSGLRSLSSRPTRKGPTTIAVSATVWALWALGGQPVDHLTYYFTHFNLKNCQRYQIKV
ncbi:Cobyrinic acid ac-diamide synthase [Anopheles sinensis]|uniref:Cobyrinic acid ac-diamide synthase n=1 Tax=Anopheles sinensis TaxID=74873 RepID=A0A084VV91_ANOSI|nr:Cobyrinic acid ac-diamide synthase [Anopheles sinensis]